MLIDASESVEVRETGRWAGHAAAACAILFALISLHWGFGGTLALDTVGSQTVELVEAGDVGIYLAVWLAAFVKLVAGLLALALVQPWGKRLLRHWTLVLVGWGATVTLILYGSAQISVQLMVLARVVVPRDETDWRGFYGHLYIWNPWFVVWGVLMGIATLYYTRNAKRRRAAEQTGNSANDRITVADAVRTNRLD